LAKIAMVYLSPFQFLGARYSIAFVVLIPFVVRTSWPHLRKLSKVDWIRLVLMGVIAYPLANGLQFWALTRLSATVGTFTMNFVPLFTVGLGIVFLSEKPTIYQLVGIMLALLGTLVFFGIQLEFEDTWAILASTLGSLLLASNAVLVRSFARTGRINSVALAAIPLGIGGGILLLFAPPTSMPPLKGTLIVLFLGIISGSLAFTVWNHALRRLRAFEITVIGNLMPMGTAILAPLILDETVSLQAWLGILVTLVGVVLVSLLTGAPPPAVVKVGMATSERQ
jgi:drug/metabolite transporter (DMT)-like permease